MVYLDAAYDHASDQELFDRVRSQFSLSPIKLDDPYLSAIIAGSNQFHPDYDNVTAPCAELSCDLRRSSRLREAYWEEYSNAFSRGQTERFRNEVTHAKVVALHHTSQSEFLTDPEQQNIVVSEMRSFLARD